MEGRKEGRKEGGGTDTHRLVERRVSIRVYDGWMMDDEKRKSLLSI